MQDKNHIYKTPLAISNALKDCKVPEDVSDLYCTNSALIEQRDNDWLKQEFKEAEVRVQSVGGDVNELRARHGNNPPTYSEGGEGATIYDMGHAI